MGRILLLEDEITPRFALQKALAEAGHKVLATSTAEQCLREAGRFRPELLVSDWMIGGGATGSDVALRLRETDPDLPVVFVSGMPKEDIRADVAQVGGSIVLRKPVRPQELISTAGQLLAARPPLPEPRPPAPRSRRIQIVDGLQQGVGPERLAEIAEPPEPAEADEDLVEREPN